MSAPLPASSFDYVLVGGGLQNALVAHALVAFQPDARVALVEAERRLGQAHTWCFHGRDIDSGATAFVSSLVARRWDGYDVKFPGLERELSGVYACVTGDRLHEVTLALFAESTRRRLLLGKRARRIEAHEVELDDGELLKAEVVIDARGPSRLEAAVAGYQKFLGLELEFEGPHGVVRPLLMDARVDQVDGFRFMYVLPFGPTRALVEDTRFSDTSALSQPELRGEILAYVRARGLTVKEVVREELGILPLPSRLPKAELKSPLRAGYAGGWLHPTTGYSFPVAARLANFIARRRPEQLFGAEFERLALEQARQVRFANSLNRLLFDAVAPEHRRGVFERFYRLDAATISRFYALTTEPLDRARILCGRPPRGLSLRRALSRGVSL
jgi:lycopene beta-cyclase